MALNYNDCNVVVATSNLRREEPFRGIATARQKWSLLAMTQLDKGLLQWRFREIAHTRNAPLLSLERQRHFPRSVGGISLACAVKNKRLSRYDVILNECLFACFLTTSAEVSKHKVREPITNG